MRIHAISNRHTNNDDTAVAKEIDTKHLFATLCYMSTVIRISDELARDAKIKSKVEHRSMTSQIEYWATIGKAVEENPDLPFAFIKDTLMALEEAKVKGTEEYVFG